MMNNEDGALWDNDPYAIPKTKKSKAMVMSMVYNRLLVAGVKTDSQEAKDYSEDMPMTYAEWVAERSQSK